MSEQNTELTEVTPPAVVPSEEKPVDVTIALPKSMDMVKDTMDKFLSAASVNAVYAEPVQHGDTLMINSAEVLSGMGFGMGVGVGNNTDKDEGGKPVQNSGGGGGGGGGGRILSRPVAVIVATPDGVYVEPIVDVTKVALAALTAGGFILGMLLRMLRGKIADEE